MELISLLGVTRLLAVGSIFTSTAKCMIQLNFYISIYPSLKTQPLSLSQLLLCFIDPLSETVWRKMPIHPEPTNQMRQAHRALWTKTKTRAYGIFQWLSLSLFLVRRGSYRWTLSAPFTAAWMEGSALSSWKPRSTNHSQTSPRADRDTFSQCQATRRPGIPKRPL